MRITLQSSSNSTLSAISWEGQSELPLSGSDFLLVHGLASNAETWRLVGDQLASQGARVVAIDQRSHGLSEPTASGFDFVTISADLAHVVSQTGLSRPIVVGQSWGGNVVVEFSARYPDLVHSVIGIDGGHIRLRDKFESWEVCKAALTPPPLAGTNAALMRERMEAFHPEWTEAAISAAMANFRITDGRIYPHLDLDHHLQILHAMYDHDPRRALRADQPSMLVMATGGKAFDDQTFTNPGFDRIETVEGDHDLHLHRPETVARLIAEMST